MEGGGGCGKQKEGAERKKIILSGRQNAKHAGFISGPILPKMAGKEGVGVKGGGVDAIGGEEEGGVNSEGYRLEKTEGWNVDKG